MDSVREEEWKQQLTNCYFGSLPFLSAGLERSTIVMAIQIRFRTVRYQYQCEVETKVQGTVCEFTEWWLINKTATYMYRDIPSTIMSCLVHETFGTHKVYIMWIKI